MHYPVKPELHSKVRLIQTTVCLGFAPSDSAQIAFAIRIANGYSSTFAAEVGNDVMEYYYKVTPENELITGSASDIGTGSNGGD